MVGRGGEEREREEVPSLCSYRPAPSLLRTEEEEGERALPLLHELPRHAAYLPPLFSFFHGIRRTPNPPFPSPSPSFLPATATAAMEETGGGRWGVGGCSSHDTRRPQKGERRTEKGKREREKESERERERGSVRVRVWGTEGKEKEVTESAQWRRQRPHHRLTCVTWWWTLTMAWQWYRSDLDPCCSRPPLQTPCPSLAPPPHHHHHDEPR